MKTIEFTEIIEDPENPGTFGQRKTPEDIYSERFPGPVIDATKSPGAVRKARIRQLVTLFLGFCLGYGFYFARLRGYL